MEGDPRYHLGMCIKVDETLAVLKVDQVQSAPLSTTNCRCAIGTHRNDLDRAAGPGDVGAASTIVLRQKSEAAEMLLIPMRPVNSSAGRSCHLVASDWLARRQETIESS